VLISLGCIYGQKTALQNAYKAGHQIASHSWSHPSNFGSLSAADLTTQMTRLEQALVNIIGVKPTYMRPPYLATGGTVLSTMKTLGYRVITDDIDTGDWNNQTPQQSEQKFTQAGAGGNGHIPLMHETYASTVNTLTPWLINWAKNNNLKLVSRLSRQRFPVPLANRPQLNALATPLERTRAAQRMAKVLARKEQSHDETSVS
jgi:peptidoglycan/xylan/chitin deacetylase (PgdA/CDA1 family)